MIMFLHGLIAACFVVAGAFFFRFWRETLDRLFLLFALSFWLQALIRIGLSAFAQHDGAVFLYALRLTAYALIVAAILDKNFVEKRRGPRK
jgi:hypothetical protein